MRSLCPTGKRAGTCFGSSKTHILLLFSVLPSLMCEVSLTKVNSKVLRSSQLVSAGGGRNSTLGAWALALWDTLRTCSRVSLMDKVMLPGAGHCAVPSSPPAAPTGRALCNSLCAPCRVPCAQDDTCLAELALALSLSLEISSKRRLVGVRLCIQTLQAELHEGLFCSPLLHHVTAGAQHSSTREEPSSGQDGQGQAQGRAGTGGPHSCTGTRGIWLRDRSLLLQGVGVWPSPSCDSLCPSPGPGEPSKSLSVLSRDTLKLIPRRVEMKLENTSMVLSLNSQKR